jgi:hypothetical protein
MVFRSSKSTRHYTSFALNSEASFLIPPVGGEAPARCRTVAAIDGLTS